MKKITLLIALIAFSLQSNSQVLLSESFDTSLNWTVIHTLGTSTNPGWTRVTEGVFPSIMPAAGAGMARFNTYNINAGNSYSLNSPAIAMTGGSYRVTFNMYRDEGYPDAADRVRVYVNTIASSTGGTLLGTVNRSIALAPAVSTPGWYTYSFDIPGNPNGNRHISILGSSAYGSNLYIDEVKVVTIQNNDLMLSSLDMADIMSGSGSILVSGAIRNFGANTINSLDISWQADGGEVHTQNVTGLNLAAGQTYNFTHSTPWAAGIGSHEITVWASNPNGVADVDTSNNTIVKTISVASNSTARMALYEKFTSSTCPPCAGFNGTFFTPFYTNNHDEFALINYQVNWPGAGDPYYTAEIGTRVQYYGITAAPTLLVDAKEGTNYSVPGLESDLNTANAEPSFFAVAAEHTITGNMITVDVDVTPYLSGAYTLRAVVVEKQTTGNVASNGETEFKNVAMKIMPSAVGMVVDFVHDVPQNIQLVADLSPTNVEQMTDLDVVVFIQHDASKKVMQSTYATNALNNGEFTSASALKLYPNPTNGIVRISTENSVDVTISDLTGKVIFAAKGLTNQSEIDLSQYQSGIYIAKMANGETQKTQKIVLK